MRKRLMVAPSPAMVIRPLMMIHGLLVDGNVCVSTAGWSSATAIFPLRPLDIQRITAAVMQLPGPASVFKHASLKTQHELVQPSAEQTHLLTLIRTRKESIKVEN